MSFLLSFGGTSSLVLRSSMTTGSSPFFSCSISEFFASDYPEPGILVIQCEPIITSVQRVHHVKYLIESIRGKNYTAGVFCFFFAFLLLSFPLPPPDRCILIVQLLPLPPKQSVLNGTLSSWYMCTERQKSHLLLTLTRLGDMPLWTRFVFLSQNAQELSQSRRLQQRLVLLGNVSFPCCRWKATSSLVAPRRC